jgi:hypothetical protein
MAQSALRCSLLETVCSAKSGSTATFFFTVEVLVGSAAGTLVSCVTGFTRVSSLQRHGEVVKTRMAGRILCWQVEIREKAKEGRASLWQEYIPLGA